MKKLSVLALGAILALTLGLMPVLAAGDMPAADAQAVWDYITKTSPYQKWGQFSELKGIQPSKAVHGTKVQILANTPALGAKAVPLPEGSTIVKEGMGDDQKVTMVLVMYKVKG